MGAASTPYKNATGVCGCLEPWSRGLSLAIAEPVGQRVLPVEARIDLQPPRGQVGPHPVLVMPQVQAGELLDAPEPVPGTSMIPNESGCYGPRRRVLGLGHADRGGHDAAAGETGLGTGCAGWAGGEELERGGWEERGGEQSGGQQRGGGGLADLPGY